MQITIIGGSGFVGTRLTKRLLEAGHTVKIADKRKSVTYPELSFGFAAMCVIVEMKQRNFLQALRTKLWLPVRIKLLRNLSRCTRFWKFLKEVMWS